MRARAKYALAVVIVLLVGAIYVGTGGGSDTEEAKPVQELTSLLQSPERLRSIREVKVQPLGEGSAKYVVKFRSGTADVVVVGPYSGAGTSLTDDLAAHGVSWTVESSSSTPLWQELLVALVPILVIGLLVYFFMMRGASGKKGPLDFGKSKAKLLTANQVKVTFKDVAGIQEAREEVEEIIAFLDNPAKFKRLGGRIPKGVLLSGSPGTGKTLLARAIAGEANVPFYAIAGSDFVEMFVGVGASRVRDLFAQGKKNAPCIIFIDEIDAVGRRRGAGVGSGSDESEQTLNQLLVEMDGFESTDGVILIAATNRPDVLDPALLRPGRFDRVIHVSLPDIKGRLDILKIHTRKVPMAADVDLSMIARGTSGFSGADLGNLTNEGALLAARREQDSVRMIEFEDAKDKILMGSPRHSMFVSDRERHVSALREAGHALVSTLILNDEVDPLHKVTIIPRGEKLGLTLQLPVEDRLTISRSFLVNRICILMGGRVAEELGLQQRSSGAARAIREATRLARKMVTEWGMSESLGPVRYESADRGVFLESRMPGRGNSPSEEFSEAIELEVARFVAEQSDRATTLLSAHRTTLQAICDALLSRETLSGAEVRELVDSSEGALGLAT